jgi:hypothetical protein
MDKLAVPTAYAACLLMGLLALFLLAAPMPGI